MRPLPDAVSKSSNAGTGNDLQGPSELRQGWHVSGLPGRHPCERLVMPAKALFTVTLSAIALASGTSPYAAER